MEETGKYFVVRKKAVPEVLLKVVEAKMYLSADRRMTVKEAADRAGISRSSFYKYKDDIFPFSEGARGRMKTPPLFRRAVGTDGSRLGAITGAEIDEVTFAVTALELSRGLWDDLARGRQSVTRYTADPETGGIVVDPAGEAKEGEAYEGRLDQGTDRRDGDRIGGGGDVRRRQLADGAQPEPEGEVGGQLDRQQG